MKFTLVFLGASLLATAIAPPSFAANSSRFGSGKVAIEDICKHANCPNAKDQKEAARLARNWLSKIERSGLSVQSTNATAQYKNTVVQYEDRPPFPIINIHAYEGVWPSTLHFSRPINSSMSIDEIQAAVQSFSNGGFPTPGLEVPNWKFVAQTPKSHVESGIRILEVAPGHLKFSVKTSFFALWGYDKRMPDIADISTPPEAYVSIKKPFTGTAIITYKVKGF